MIRSTLFFILMLAVIPAVAQNESRLHSEFRIEGDALKACTQLGFKNLADCGQTIIMGQPMHIAVGSLAPQNGFGAGLAFVEHKHFASEWRDNFDIDAVATPNGSWRAGLYLKAYRLPGGTIRMSFPGSHSHAHAPLFSVAPLFNFYSQFISLNQIDYYGIGPNTSRTAKTDFGFNEDITGASAVLPLSRPLPKARLSIDLQLNARFPSVRPGPTGEPSTQMVYTEDNTPGLTHQTGYLQPSEGLRLTPSLFNGYLRLNYFGVFQQFIAPANSAYSFRRWEADFTNSIPLYNFLPLRSSRHNGPDDCSGSGDTLPAVPCPVVSATQKLEGSVILSAFLSESMASSGSRIPFYFMPTIGGSDIDGTRMIASYHDYRFRGPDLILFKGSIEHSLGRLPVGILLSAEGGKIAVRRDDIGLDHFRHTFSVGFTLRAGGLPLIDLVYAWGGSEGSHSIATVSPTLLGGSSRPSLF